MADLLFRHEQFRPGQKELASDAWNALHSSSNLMASAPTGCGKTDAVLSPAITYALEHDLTVFFLTPKISQHEIACNAVRGIASKYQGEEKIAKLRAIDFVGRRHMCLDDAVRESDAFYELCNRKKRKNSCAYYANTKKKSSGQISLAPPKIDEIASAYGAVRGHLELHAECKKFEVCPYEAASKIAKNSSVVIADYHHLFAPAIRDTFLARIEKMVENSIVIVDEAHNLPSRVSEHLSSTLKQKTIERAAQEAKSLEFEELEQSLLRFSKAYVELKRKFLKKTQEVFLDADELEKETSISAPELSEQLASCGMEFLEKYSKSKSASLRLAAFLANWHEHAGKKEYAQIIHRTHGLRLSCLDASRATKVLNNARSSIIMSGTLLPLEAYRNILGLDEARTMMKEYPSPFPKENKLNIIINSVTTRYSQRSDAQYQAIASKIQHALNAMNFQRTALFFPSYGVMKNTLFHVSIPEGKLFAQRPAMHPAETSALLRSFKQKKGVLAGVMGGSLSEGLDYNESEIQCICLIGVPLAEKSLEVDAAVSYFDQKFGSGWDYAVTIPSMNKAVQASGRGIRKESDKCIVLYLDERYTWNAYAKCLPQSERFTVANEPWKSIPQFLGNEAIDAVYL